MVLAANEKQAASEKALQEATMKIDVLQAEVAALKTLVITSTPSRPNAHLHPQIDLGKSNGEARLSGKVATCSVSGKCQVNGIYTPRFGKTDMYIVINMVVGHLLSSWALATES